jgi:hypothetical protein
MRARDVPFAAEAVDGWRAWSVIESDGDVWLSSLTRPEDWEPAVPFVANCSRRRHQAPGRACSCGVYAAGKPEELAGLGRIAGAAVGQVSLWGRVAEHSRGYRAQTAYPARLRLVCVTCLAAGDGVPATLVDRDRSRGRTRIVPLCDAHTDGRSLPAVREIEDRLLARYQVEPVPHASIERIRRDPSVEDAERRSRRRTIVLVAAALAILSLGALVGELGRSEEPVHDSTTAAERVLGDYIMRPLTDVRRRQLNTDADASACGMVTPNEVVPIDCGDPRVEVRVESVVSSGRHQGPLCDDRTTVMTMIGDRVICWRDVKGRDVNE